MTAIQDLNNIKKFIIQKVEEKMKSGKRNLLNLLLNFRYLNKPSLNFS